MRAWQFCAISGRPIGIAVSLPLLLFLKLPDECAQVHISANPEWTLKLLVRRTSPRRKKGLPVYPVAAIMIESAESVRYKVRYLGAGGVGVAIVFLVLRRLLPTGVRSGLRSAWISPAKHGYASATSATRSLSIAPLSATMVIHHHHQLLIAIEKMKKKKPNSS